MSLIWNKLILCRINVNNILDLSRWFRAFGYSAVKIVPLFQGGFITSEKTKADKEPPINLLLLPPTRKRNKERHRLLKGQQQQVFTI